MNGCVVEGEDRMRQIAWRHAGVFGVKRKQDCSMERGEEVE
jgi:hypothetical protein